MANIPVNMNFKAKGLEAIKGAFNNLIEPAAVFASTGSKASAAWAGIKTVLITKVLGPLSLLSGAVGGVIAGFKLLLGSAQLLAKGMEQVRDIQYTTQQFAPLLNGIENARKHVESLYKFAAETPFQIGDIAGASKQLEILTRGALGGAQNLKMIADAAAVSGQGMQSVGMWVARLYDGLQAGRPVGEAMARLQEMGLVTGLTRKKIEEGTKAGKSFTVMWEMMSKEFKRNEGASKELSQTLGGLESTLIDVKAKFEGKFAEHFLEGEMEATKRSIAAFQTLEGPVSRMGFWFSKVTNVFEKFKTSLYSGFGLFEGAGNTLGKFVDIFLILGAAIMAAQFTVAASGVAALASATGRAAAAANAHGLMEIFRTAGLKAATLQFWKMSFAAKISTIAQGGFIGVMKVGKFVVAMFTKAIGQAWAAMLAHPLIAIVAALAAVVMVLYRHNSALQEATKASKDMSEGARKTANALRDEAQAVTTLEGKLALINKTMIKVKEAQQQRAKLKQTGSDLGGTTMDIVTGGVWNKTEKDSNKIEQQGANEAYSQMLAAMTQVLNIDQASLALNEAKKFQIEEQVKLARQLKDASFARNMDESSAAGKIILLEGRRAQIAQRLADIEKTRSAQTKIGDNAKRAQIEEAKVRLQRLASQGGVDDTRRQQGAYSARADKADKARRILAGVAIGAVGAATGGAGLAVGAGAMAAGGAVGGASTNSLGAFDVDRSGIEALGRAADMLEGVLDKAEAQELRDIRSALEDTSGLVSNLGHDFAALRPTEEDAAAGIADYAKQLDVLRTFDLEALKGALKSGRIYSEEAATAIEALRAPIALLGDLEDALGVEHGLDDIMSFDELSDGTKKIIGDLEEMGIVFADVSNFRGGGDWGKGELFRTGGAEFDLKPGSEIAEVMKLLGEDGVSVSTQQLEDAIGLIKKERMMLDRDATDAARTASDGSAPVADIMKGTGQAENVFGAGEEEAWKLIDEGTRAQIVLIVKERENERKKFAELNGEAQKLKHQQDELLENLRMQVSLRKIDENMRKKVLALGMRDTEVAQKKLALEKEALLAKKKLLEDASTGRDEASTKEDLARKGDLAKKGQTKDAFITDAAIAKKDAASLTDQQKVKRGELAKDIASMKKEMATLATKKTTLEEEKANLPEKLKQAQLDKKKAEEDMKSARKGGVGGPGQYANINQKQDAIREAFDRKKAAEAEINIQTERKEEIEGELEAIGKKEERKKGSIKSKGEQITEIGDQSFGEKELEKIWEERKAAWIDAQAGTGDVSDMGGGKTHLRKADALDRATGANIQKVKMTEEMEAAGLGKFDKTKAAADQEEVDVVQTGAVFEGKDEFDASVALHEEMAKAAAETDKALGKTKQQLEENAAATRELNEQLRRMIRDYRDAIKIASVELDVDIAIGNEKIGLAHDQMVELNRLEEKRIKLLRYEELVAKNISDEVAKEVVNAEALQRSLEKGLVIRNMLKDASKTQEQSALSMQARAGDQEARKKLESIENKDFFKAQLEKGVGAGMGKEENIQQAQQLLNAKLMDEVGESKITADSMRKIGAGGYSDATDPMQRLAEKQLAAQKAVLPILMEMLNVQKQHLPGKPIPVQ